MRLIDADFLRNKLSILENTTASSLAEHSIMWRIRDIVDNMPTEEDKSIVRCKDCKWWDKKDESPYGYCHACKHGHRSEHWEISIYRTYKGDWYCADGERKDGGEE